MAAIEVSKKVDDGEIRFFGDFETNPKTGKPTSEMPAWSMTVHINELEESIVAGERQLLNKTVPDMMIARRTAEVAQLREKLKKIHDSKQLLTAGQKDKVSEAYKELQTQVQDSLFTVTEMKKGFASAHEEARRMSEPIIPVGKSALFLKNIGIVPRDGKISRNDASKMYRVSGAALGENTMVEKLRRDAKHGTYRSEPTLDEMGR